MGVIIGLLLAIIVLILVKKNENKFHRMFNSPRLNPIEKAYIAGLSDEEQKFRDNLPEKI